VAALPLLVGVLADERRLRDRAGRAGGVATPLLCLFAVAAGRAAVIHRCRGAGRFH
jgi:hypothetical protein